MDDPINSDTLSTSDIEEDKIARTTSAIVPQTGDLKYCEMFAPRKMNKRSSQIS